MPRAPAPLLAHRPRLDHLPRAQTGQGHARTSAKPGTSATIVSASAKSRESRAAAPRLAFHGPRSTARRDDQSATGESETKASGLGIRARSAERAWPPMTPMTRWPSTNSARASAMESSWIACSSALKTSGCASFVDTSRMPARPGSVVAGLETRHRARRRCRAGHGRAGSARHAGRREDDRALGARPIKAGGRVSAQHDHLVEVAPVIEAAILAQVEILQAQPGRRKTRCERASSRAAKGLRSRCRRAGRVRSSRINRRGSAGRRARRSGGRAVQAHPTVVAEVIADEGLGDTDRVEGRCGLGLQ